MRSFFFMQTLTAIIAVQDILMSFCLGTPEWFSSRSYGWIGIAMLRSIIAYAAVVAMVISLHVYVVPRLLRFLTAMEEVHRSPLVLLGVVSVCLFMALFTEMIGLSLECGAFLAGLAFVNVSADAKAAFTSIRVLENLFGSMFFGCVGMILNPMFLLKNAGEILSMVILILLVKTFSMTVVMTFLRISIRRALTAAVGLCQIGELALIFMIKAHHTDLVSRRIYLLFVAAISIFLGCSSLFDRQVVLARRKNIFRLPSDRSRRPGTLSVAAADRSRGSASKMFPVSYVAVPIRDRAGSSIGDINDFGDSGGEGDDVFSPPTSPHRHRHRVT
jgi:Kef-type K+ transport system membrane component KefB